MIKRLAYFFIIFSTSAYAVTEELAAKADAGDADSQYLMGYSFEKGEDNPLDPAKATFWYEKAVAADHPAAKHRLGLMYATGTWVKQDFNITAELFESAAKQKYPAAQMDYAMFLVGLAPPEYKKPIEAYAWLTVLKKNFPASSDDVSGIMQQLDSMLSKTELIEAIELGKEYVAAYSPEQSE